MYWGFFFGTFWSGSETSQFSGGGGTSELRNYTEMASCTHVPGSKIGQKMFDGEIFFVTRFGRFLRFPDDFQLFFRPQTAYCEISLLL